MSERLLIIAGFAWMTAGLVLIAYQNVRIAQLVAELGALIARTH